MPITLAEVLQMSFDLVKRAEQAEARVAALEQLLAEVRRPVHDANTPSACWCSPLAAKEEEWPSLDQQS